MRQNKHPDRLTSASYMPTGSLLFIERHTIGRHIKIHWHEFYEMALVTDGSGFHMFNGTNLPLERGSLFLLTPADFHAIQPEPGSLLETFNVIFSTDFLNTEVCQLVFQHLHNFQTSFTGSGLLAIEAEFTRLFVEIKSNQLAYQRICYGIMERILIDLVRHSMVEEETEPAEQTHEPYQVFHPALTYMHHHFREELSLAEVASQVHLSPNYFSERFSEIHGVSFQRYLQDLRLQFAYSLLSASALPITEICYAAGFKTLSHFERAFKQKFGRAPRSLGLALRQANSSEEA